MAPKPLGPVVRQPLNQWEATSALGWPKTRLSLIETARVRLTVAHARALLMLYRTGGAERETILELAQEAEQGADHALSWITSHSFRKTVATVLDEVGQSGRQMADQLGHARHSMTQDNYVGREVRNPQAVAALEAAFERLDEPKSGYKAGTRRISDDGSDA